MLLLTLQCIAQPLSNTIAALHKTVTWKPYEHPYFRPNTVSVLSELSTSRLHKNSYWDLNFDPRCVEFYVVLFLKVMQICNHTFIPS